MSRDLDKSHKVRARVPPLRGKLEGLPSAFVATAEVDPLREGIAYAKAPRPRPACRRAQALDGGGRMIALILATIWLWDKPVQTMNGEGNTWQAFVCRQRIEHSYCGCFAYGVSSPVDGVACPTYWWEKAAIDFRGENYVCAWVKQSDLDVPLGLKP